MNYNPINKTSLHNTGIFNEAHRYNGFNSRERVLEGLRSNSSTEKIVQLQRSSYNQ